jgi:diketogulonate reductase-like aldo/keto reductase
VPRDQIFVTTKVPCCKGSYDAYCEQHGFGDLTTEQAVDRDLRELGLPQTDLILMHWPCEDDADTVQIYLDLEKALAAGKTRAIGVSNFNVSHYQALEKGGATVKPAINQCKMSVGAHDDTTIAYSLANNITYESYAPLGGTSGVDVLSDPDVKVSRAAALFREWGRQSDFTKGVVAGWGVSAVLATQVVFPFVRVNVSCSEQQSWKETLAPLEEIVRRSTRRTIVDVSVTLGPRWWRAHTATTLHASWRLLRCHHRHRRCRLRRRDGGNPHDNNDDDDDDDDGGGDQRIAVAHNRSAAQVALRWVLQRQAIFVTAGTNEEYLLEDLDVFDFELTVDEMTTLNNK